MFTHTLTCKHSHTCTHVQHVHTHVQHVHIHVYTTCMCTGLGTCALTQTHLHTHAHIQTHTHTQDNPMVDKRAHHNALERRRRDHIKDSFHDLRDCIPSLQGEKVDTFPSSSVSVFLSSPSCPPPPAFPPLLFYLLTLSVSFLLPLVLPLLPSCFTFLPSLLSVFAACTFVLSVLHFLHPPLPPPPLPPPPIPPPPIPLPLLVLPPPPLSSSLPHYI